MRGEQLILPGDVVAGAYRVDHLLRAGPLCTVAAARHVTERGTFAIKIVDTSVNEGPRALERLESQLRASSLVQNEHIAAAHELGEIDDHRHYLVMEYLRGHNLAEMIDGPASHAMTRIVDLVLQTCQGLAEAHGVGIVHRDLNPTHIFVAETPEGRSCVKILDFGSARFPGLLSTGSGESERPSLAAALGQPPFVSPEQLLSRDHADERSDIWAIGVLLYLLLTGKVPFPADTPALMRSMVLGAPARAVHEDRADVPLGLARVVARCLEKDPEERYQDLSELAMSLAAFGPSRAMDSAQKVAAALVGAGIRPREALSTIPNLSAGEEVDADVNPFRRATRRLGDDAPDKALLDRILLERRGRVEHLAPVVPERKEVSAHPPEIALEPAAPDLADDERARREPIRARRDLRFLVLLVIIVLGALAGYALLGRGPWA